ncbi:RHS repeat domain-containing protein, partial [Pseudomonas salomonii]
RFTWDGLRLLQEHKHSQTSLYVYEDEGYQPLARVDGAGPLQKTRYYHNDLNGLPEQLTEADGRMLWQATYRVWGNTLEEVREPYYIEEQNLRFQGQYLDRETGLHFNTFRFYDPDVGRFTTPDPIGLAGGINLYKYAPNPISWIDPWGLLNLNTNGAQGNFGVYEIRIDGELHKYGKADMNRVTKSSGNPTRLHQQVEKLERLNPGKTIKGTILQSGISTTEAAKTIETAKLDAHYKKTGGLIPEGNKKSYKGPKSLCGK